MRTVQGKASMIVSGGTGSGKTTLLNMLLLGIPENELVVTIEDSCELKHNRKNIRRLEARLATGELGVLSVPVRALVKNALRMRPDRIIVGEIRDETIVDMVSAMSTGHEGSLSTVHANSPQNLIKLECLFVLYVWGQRIYSGSTSDSAIRGIGFDCACVQNGGRFPKSNAYHPYCGIGAESTKSSGYFHL